MAKFVTLIAMTFAGSWLFNSYVVHRETGRLLDLSEAALITGGACDESECGDFDDMTVVCDGGEKECGEGTVVACSTNSCSSFEPVSPPLHSDEKRTCKFLRSCNICGHTCGGYIDWDQLDLGGCSHG
jgi:hypothetical protein